MIGRIEGGGMRVRDLEHTEHRILLGLKATGPHKHYTDIVSVNVTVHIIHTKRSKKYMLHLLTKHETL